MRKTTRALSLLIAAGALALAGCGDDDDTAAEAGADVEEVADDAADEATDDEATDDDAMEEDAMEEDESADDAASGGGGAGSLVLDGETIELGPGLCYLEEQPSAGGGGSILATAQAEGTTAGGEEVRIDFTRFSEDSQFAGDDVSVDLGPLGDSVSYMGSEPEGTVSVDGNVVSATDFPLVNADDATPATVSFTINC